MKELTASELEQVTGGVFNAETAIAVVILGTPVLWAFLALGYVANKQC